VGIMSRTGKEGQQLDKALGKEVVFFDRPEDRLHLRERRIAPHHRASFELRQGAATALRPPT
jgi:hypothetical protein